MSQQGVGAFFVWQESNSEVKNSGHCVDQSQRCDEASDCADGSDETLCYLVHIPPSYKKDEPPQPMAKTTALNIITKLEIVNVDSIDTINMVVTLTVEIRMKWHDERLVFSTLL